MFNPVGLSCICIYITCIYIICIYVTGIDCVERHLRYLEESILCILSITDTHTHKHKHVTP